MAGFDLNRMPKGANALWFFVALFGGGVAIWWTKSVSEDAWIAAAVAAGVVLLLTVYYVLNDENAPEEEGDNVYYLGLLYTLLSLMFALVELFGSGSGAARDPDNIHTLLEHFGIALTSTVVGIAGRVAVQNWQRAGFAAESDFLQGPPVPAPAVGASPADLAGFNRHLLGMIARDLTQGANALARFHRIVRSHASDSEEYLRNHSESLKRESAEFKDMLQRNAEMSARELESRAERTLNTVGGSLGATAKQAEALLEQLRSAHDGYLAELRETTRSFHDEIRSASNRSIDVLQRNYGAVAEQSLSLAENLSAVHERVDKAFDNLDSGLKHASNASAVFGDNADRAAKSAGILELEVGKLRTALAEAHAGADAMRSIVDAIGDADARLRAGRDAEQTAAAVQQIGDALGTISARTATATEKAVEAAELFDALTQSVRTTESETRRAADALRVLADEADERVEVLRQRQGQGWGRFWDRNR